MKIHIFWFALICLSTGQYLVQYQPPAVSVVAPVRVEGKLSASGVNTIHVSVPFGTVWSVSVYDSCSTSTCTGQPSVTVVDSSHKTYNTVACGVTLSLPEDTELLINISSRTAYNYGIVVTSASYLYWNGGCDSGSIVRETETNDYTAQSLPHPPVHLEGALTKGDQDLYKIQIDSAGSYTFSTQSSCRSDCMSGPDTILYVDGSINDDYNLTRCSSVELQLQPGAYDILITGYEDDIGAYSLAVVSSGIRIDLSCPVEWSLPGVNLVPSISPDAIGRTVCTSKNADTSYTKAIGVLIPPFYIPNVRLADYGNRDHYYFGVRTGYYNILVYGSQDLSYSCANFTCNFDTVLAVYDSSGSLIGVNDDGNVGLCSGFQVYLTEGNYYAVVSSYGGRYKGVYSLMAYPAGGEDFFLNSENCPATQTCPICAGSGIEGSAPGYGRYYKNSGWWIVLVIVGSLLAFFLITLFIAILLDSNSWEPPRQRPTSSPAPVRNERVDLSSSSSVLEQAKDSSSDVRDYDKKSGFGVNRGHDKV